MHAAPCTCSRHPVHALQVVVSFELSEEMVLLVTAHDRIGDQFKSLTIKDRLPTPPRKRPT